MPKTLTLKPIPSTAESEPIMRILWLTENFPPRRGGMAQACDRIVSNLRKNGLIIDVAFFSAGCQQSRIIEQQNGRLIMVAAGESPGHDLNCFWNLLNSESIKVDYTHIVAFGGSYPILALPVLKAWLKACAITMLRGNDFDLGIFLPQKRAVLADAIEASDFVCALSLDQQKKVASIHPGAQIKHIPNGIDLQDWKVESCDQAAATGWREKTVTGNRLVIGLIGQFKAKKGGQFFLENVLQANLQQRFHFLLIGDVEPPMEDWLDQHSQQLEISRLPFLDRFELLSKYPACDYLALPSHYDGMPNVLLEAGALGIPVIAARSGGITDVLPEEMLPLTFHPGERNECRKALWNAAQSTSMERQFLGQTLALKISSNFTAAIETSKYFSMFNHRKPSPKSDVKGSQNE